jgi:hypothetical protein
MTEYLNAGSADNYNRPNAFVITTETPEFWETPSTFNQANFPYDPGLIYEANAYSDTDVTYAAAEYGAQIGRNPAELDGGFDFQSAIGTNVVGTNGIIEGDILDFYGLVILPDPTNEPARIELTANQLNLSNSRLRAEGMVIVNATNLAGTAAGYDWGEINAQLGAANGSLVVSNFFPTNFQRLRGDVYAWSANWVNTFTNGITNTFHYNLLVVDQNLGGNFQSAIRNLSLTGSNSINVQDSVYVINQAYFNTTNLTFSSNAVFTQNAGSLVGANMPALKNFLVNSNGVLEVDNVLDIGLDQTKIQAPPANRQYTIASITNLGQIEATESLFQSAVFENDGGIMSGSSMIIKAQTLDMGLELTNQVNFMYVSGSLNLSAQNISVTNSYIYTEDTATGGGSSLTLETTSDGQITDGVPNTPATNNVLNNFWYVTGGFNLPVKPATGDLFGTEIETIATNSTIAQHIWAGRGDYTNVVDGFADNVVIGHLILSRQSAGAELHFSGAGVSNGMYVDYLELDTNSLSYTDYREGLVIDTNLTIYFADSNVDPNKLATVYTNRLVWVTNFWGPNSTVMVTNKLHTNQVCAMNAAVADSLDPAVAFFPPTLNYDNQPYVLNNPDPPYNWFNTNGECPSFTITIESAARILDDITNFASVKGTYNGLFHDTNQLSSANSGFFTFTLSKNETFSGRLLMGPTNYTFSGSGSNKFNTNGAARVTAKHGRESLAVNLQLVDTADGTPGVQGYVSNETWVAQLQGDLKPDWTAKNPSPYAGQYTMILTNGGTNNVPGGDSYGSLTVSKLGVLSVAGKLADGNAFSQSVPISTNGLWPFYTYVAEGGDFLLGWIAFQTSDSGAVTLGQTNLFWSKAPSSKDRYYPAGFSSTNFDLAGSPYAFPGRNSSGLTLTNPVVILSGGGLVAMTNPVAYNEKLVYANSNLTLSINPTVGSFTGRLKLAEDGPSIKMDGVVLQDQEGAFGFFLSTNDESGVVLLQSQ